MRCTVHLQAARFDDQTARFNDQCNVVRSAAAEAPSFLLAALLCIMLSARAFQAARSSYTSRPPPSEAQFIVGHGAGVPLPDSGAGSPHQSQRPVGGEQDADELCWLTHGDPVVPQRCGTTTQSTWCSFRAAVAACVDITAAPHCCGDTATCPDATAAPSPEACHVRCDLQGYPPYVGNGYGGSLHNGTNGYPSQRGYAAPGLSHAANGFADGYPAAGSSGAAGQQRPQWPSAPPLHNGGYAPFQVAVLSLS